MPSLSVNPSDLNSYPLEEESAEKLAQMNKAAAGEKVAVSMGPGFTGDILTKPIKPFVEARSRAVKDQLAGKSAGQSINPDFGGPVRNRSPPVQEQANLRRRTYPTAATRIQLPFLSVGPAAPPLFWFAHWRANVPSALGVSRTGTNTEHRLAAVVVSVTAVKLLSSTFTLTRPGPGPTFCFEMLRFAASMRGLGAEFRPAESDL